MAMRDELEAMVDGVLRGTWTERSGYVVPDTTDVRLTNDGVLLDAAVLYADIAGSTALLSATSARFVAELYKCYLNGACKILRNRGGEITSFDGDRVMAVFVGAEKASAAVRSALAISHLASQIISPRVRSMYASIPAYSNLTLRHGIGIDAGQVLVARAGIRNNNDLVWVGMPANVAAKLSAIREDPFSIFITGPVFVSMSAEVTYANGITMWEHRPGLFHGGPVWRSQYLWPL